MKWAVNVVLDRFKRFASSRHYFEELQWIATQIIEEGPRKAALCRKADSGQQSITQWLVLEYHPSWGKSRLNAALHQLNRCPLWQKETASIGAASYQVRVAWRLRLPRFVPYVHKLLSKEHIRIW